MPPRSVKKSIPKKVTKKSKAALTSTSKDKKLRKKKDPNAPKRAMSAFMFFSNDVRNQVKKERPDLQFLEIATEIGRRWQSLPDSKKTKYDAMAEKDKKRYTEEKKGYVPDPSFQSGRKKKDPNAPKRSLSAYLFYCNEFRDAAKKKFPGRKITEIATILAEEWRSLTDAMKAKFNKLAEDDKARYQAEMEMYKSNQ